MFLLRVILPDRPGSLGAVASALGRAQADISAVEIVEKVGRYAIDDFMLSLPHGARPDALITACAGLEDVEVMWVSHYPDNRNLASDADVLDAMVADADRADQVLTDAAPANFHCSWALLLDPDSGAVVHRSDQAPSGAVDAAAFGDLDRAHVADLGAQALAGLGEVSIAVAPCRSGRTVVTGRPGPEFRPSELARLRHLAQLAGDL